MSTGRKCTLGSVHTHSGVHLAVLHLDDARGMARALIELHALAQLGAGMAGDGPVWAIEFAGSRSGGRPNGRGRIREALERCALPLADLKRAVVQIASVRDALVESGCGHAGTVLASTGAIDARDVAPAHGAARTLVDAWDAARDGDAEERIEAGVTKTVCTDATHWSGTLWIARAQRTTDAKACLHAAAATARALAPGLDALGGAHDVVTATRDPRVADAEPVWAWAYQTSDETTGKTIQSSALWNAAVRATLEQEVRNAQTMH